jgi:type II secretory pathway component PulM
MKLTQKDKIMLALLCVVMVLAGVFMLVVRPMTDKKSELEAELALEQSSWDDEASTVIQSFYVKQMPKIIGRCHLQP